MTSAYYLTELQHCHEMLTELAKKAGAVDISKDHVGEAYLRGVRQSIATLDRWVQSQPDPVEEE